jgi:hypothetical protein
VSVPYTVEINDVLISAGQRSLRTRSSAVAAIVSTGFYIDGAKAPRVMAIRSQVAAWAATRGLAFK